MKNIDELLDSHILTSKSRGKGEDPTISLGPVSTKLKGPGKYDPGILRRHMPTKMFPGMLVARMNRYFGNTQGII